MSSSRAGPSVFCLLILFSALAFNEATLDSIMIHEASVKSATFLSPPFSLNPGSVLNKYYFDIPFPRGHIALKSFQGEVVDEDGVPVPLHETYLHHWVVDRYYYKKGSIIPKETSASGINISNITLVGNSGVCKHALRQYFGLGSETRKTDTWVPGPYGIVVGNPQEIPDGYEEGWLLNVHAIDTRGVEDRLGCTECKCSLYNVTKDEYGRTIPKDYIGGLYCCYDQTQCPVKRGFEGARRKLYLRYTVKWVDYDQSVLPVKIYILDATDTGMPITIAGGKTKGNRRLNCKVEYTIDPCDQTGDANGDQCVHTKIARAVIPHGGDIVYGVAHQHSGGVGSALYGQDGRTLCTSIPFYGEGKEAGNEEGYIVGMTTCYPSPGSVRVADGEVLTVVSNYSSTQMHTGVMGLFYILVAEPQQQVKTMRFHRLPISWKDESV